MKTIIFIILLVCDIYSLICAISKFRQSGEKEMPKKLKIEIWWSIFGIVVAACVLLGIE